MRVKCRAKRKSALAEDGIGIQSSLIRPEASRVRSPRHASSCIALTRPALAGGSASYQPAYSRTLRYERSEIWQRKEYRLDPRQMSVIITLSVWKLGQVTIIGLMNFRTTEQVPDLTLRSEPLQETAIRMMEFEPGKIRI